MQVEKIYRAKKVSSSYLSQFFRKKITELEGMGSGSGHPIGPPRSAGISYTNSRDGGPKRKNGRERSGP